MKKLFALADRFQEKLAVVIDDLPLEEEEIEEAPETVDFTPEEPKMYRRKMRETPGGELAVQTPMTPIERWDAIEMLTRYVQEQRYRMGRDPFKTKALQSILNRLITAPAEVLGE